MITNTVNHPIPPHLSNSSHTCFVSCYPASDVHQAQLYHECVQSVSWRCPAFCELRYKRAAIAFGFLAAIQIGAGLVLAAKDSKLWPVTGISPQRAILYHRLVGILALLFLFLHAFLFLTDWLKEGGWDLVIEESLYGSDDVNIVAGWAVLLCAIPLLLTSINFVRRRWYGIFRRVHWLFVGILILSAMHVSG